MKRLLLLRHAKAVTGSAKSGDHGRPLNDRGRNDAPKIASAMQHNNYLPDRVLCSESKRTKETWEHVAAELDSKADVVFLDALYLAPWKSIAHLVRSTPDDFDTVLVVGHNPGLEECAQALVRKPRSEGERRNLETMKEKFPTAALAVIDFDVASWSELQPGTGQLVDFIRPKDLTGE